MGGLLYLLVQFVPELYLYCTFWYSSYLKCTFIVPFGTVRTITVPLLYLLVQFWYSSYHYRTGPWGPMGPGRDPGPASCWDPLAKGAIKVINGDPHLKIGSLNKSLNHLAQFAHIINWCPHLVGGGRKFMED